MKEVSHVDKHKDEAYIADRHDPVRLPTMKEDQPYPDTLVNEDLGREMAFTLNLYMSWALKTRQTRDELLAKDSSVIEILEAQITELLEDGNKDANETEESYWVDKVYA